MYMVLNLVDLYVLLAFCMVFYAVKKYYQYLDRVRDLKLLEIQLNTVIEPEAIKGLLDDFIADIFEEYLINSSDIIQKPYITSDDEVKMRVDVVNLVADRLSPYLYQKVAVYYNEQAIPDIIAAKVYQMITAYVIDNNKIKPSRDDI